MVDRGVPESGRGLRVRLNAQLVVGVLLAAAVLAFVFQNTDDTPVNWLFFEVTQPLWVVLLATGVLSIAAGELVGSAVRRRRRKDD